MLEIDFGGVGTEAFGVKAGGINKLTGVLAGVFVLSALILGVVTKGSGTVATDLEPEVPGALPAMEGQPGTQPSGVQPVTPGGTAPGGQVPQLVRRELVALHQAVRARSHGEERRIPSDRRDGDRAHVVRFGGT